MFDAIDCWLVPERSSLHWCQQTSIGDLWNDAEHNKLLCTENYLSSVRLARTDLVIKTDHEPSPGFLCFLPILFSADRSARLEAFITMDIWHWPDILLCPCSLEYFEVSAVRVEPGSAPATIYCWYYEVGRLSMTFYQRKMWQSL